MEKQKTAQQRYLEKVVATVPCACGCGGEVAVKRYATMPGYLAKRKLRGRFLPGHLPRGVRASALAAARESNVGRSGPRAANWKGGVIEQDGYRWVRVGRHYVQEHRLVAETADSFVTHHSNLNKLDNSRANLEPMSRADHAAFHARLHRAAGSCAKIVRKVEA